VQFLDLLKGNIPFTTLRMKVLPIPENIVGINYEESKAFREKIQQWVNQLLQEKDKQIETVMTEHVASSATHESLTKSWTPNFFAAPKSKRCHCLAVKAIDYFCYGLIETDTLLRSIIIKTKCFMNQNKNPSSIRKIFKRHTN